MAFSGLYKLDGSAGFPVVLRVLQYEALCNGLSLPITGTASLAGNSSATAGSASCDKKTAEGLAEPPPATPRAQWQEGKAGRRKTVRSEGWRLFGAVVTRDTAPQG